MKKQSFIILALICLLAISINIFTSYQFMTHLFESVSSRKHELTKIYQYENFLSQLKDAEAGQLGYVLTGDSHYLELYEHALQYLESEEVQGFISSEMASPQTLDRVQTLQKLKNDKLSELKRTINISKNLGSQHALQYIRDNNEKKTLNKMRQMITDIKEEKKENLESLEKEIRQATKNNLIQLLVSNTIAAILFTACLISIYKNIQKLTRKEQELSHALQQLHESLVIRQAILNSTHYAIISVNNQGIITLFNPAAEKMLGYTTEEVVGKMTPEIFHDKKEMEERAFSLFKQLKEKIVPGMEVFTALAKQDIPDTNEWTFIRKNGTRLPAQLSVTSIKNEQNQMMGFVGVIYDLSEYKQLEHMKDELIAVTGKELREPIAAVKGAFDLLSLKEDTLPEQIKNIVEIGRKNCEYLVNLNDNLLEMQRLETGKVDFSFKKIDLALFLAQAMQIQAMAAQQAGVSLSCQSLTSPCIVEADENQLMRAMNQLMTTAILSSSAGQTIDVITERRDSRIHIEIKDPSFSFPFPSSPCQCFADSSITNSSKKENSLGLRIARLIIEKHQGTMGFEITSNGTFSWFELPIFNT